MSANCAATCIELGIPIVTTGRADPGEHVVRKLKDAGIKVVSVIPTVEHARRMEAEGVDAVVASGAEAGGHVGSVSTLPLVPQVVDAVKIPVLAAGGIGDARGFVAAFALGAVGVQMGTRFMAAMESDLNEWGRAKLLAMRETDTIVTRAMTGATVRCIKTPEIVAYEDALARRADETEITELKRIVRGSRYEESKGDRRQSAAGQVAGMSRTSALEFSFFLSMPTMIAATGYDLLKTFHPKHGAEALGRMPADGHEWTILLIGFAVSFVVALAVVAWFMNWVRQRGFTPFAIYRIVVGIAVLVWVMRG